MLRAAANMAYVAPSSPEAKAKREAPCSGAGGRAFPDARSRQGLLAPSWGTQAGRLGLLVAVGDGCQRPGLLPRSLRRCAATEPCPVANRLGTHHQWREGLGPAARSSQGRELRKGRGRHQRPDWTSAPDPTRAPFQFSPMGLGEVQADGNCGPLRARTVCCGVVWAKGTHRHGVSRPLLGEAA